MSQDLIKRAEIIRDETGDQANTAERVGGWMVDTAKELGSKASNVSLQSLDAKVNNNKTELEKKIEDSTTNNKGVFTTLAALQAAFPNANNKKDWFAFVGTSNPREKYIVKADGGAWFPTGEMHNVLDADLTDYAKNETELGKVVRSSDGTVNDKAEKRTILNVSQLTENYNYSSASEARSDVPAEFKGLGQVISYSKAANTGEGEQITVQRSELTIEQGKRIFKDGTIGSDSYSMLVSIPVSGYMSIELQCGTSNYEVGSAFFTASGAYISGFTFQPSEIVNGTRKKVTIPSDAATLKHTYLTDSAATTNGEPLFDYVTLAQVLYNGSEWVTEQFVGDDLSQWNVDSCWKAQETPKSVSVIENSNKLLESKAVYDMLLTPPSDNASYSANFDIASTNTQIFGYFVCNEQSIFDKDTTIGSLKLPIAVGGTVIVNVLLKNQDNTYAVLERIQFDNVQAGDREFKFPNGLTIPKGCILAFQGSTALRLKSYPSTNRSLKIKINDNNIHTFDSYQNSEFVYSFKSNPDLLLGVNSGDKRYILREEATNLLSDSAKDYRLKCFFVDKPNATIKQSPKRVDIITSLTETRDRIYVKRDSDDNFSIKFNFTSFYTYVSDTQTQFAFHVEFEDGGKLSFAEYQPYLNIWSDTSWIVQSKYLLGATVDFQIKDGNVEAKVNGEVVNTRSNVKIANMYFEVVNKATEQIRFFIDNLETSFKSWAEFSTTGVDITKGADVCRYREYLFCAFWTPTFQLKVVSVNMLTREVKERIFTDAGFPGTNGSIWDRHNYWAIGIDANGGIHVAGNYHTSALHYYYGESYLDLNTIAKSSKLSVSGSYPEFALFNNELYYFNRTGTSTDSKYEVWKFDTTSKTYSKTTEQNIADGQGKRGIYFGFWVEHKGWMYNAWCWRENTGQGARQINLIRTQDFVNYYGYKGEKLTLPIVSEENPSYCVDNVPVNSGLHNQWGIRPFIFDNKVHVWYTKKDEEGYYNLFLAIPQSNGDYVVKKISNYTIREDFRDADANGMGTYSEAFVRDLGEELELNWHFRYGADNTYYLNKKGEVIRKTDFIFPSPKYGDDKVLVFARDNIRDTNVISLAQIVVHYDRDKPTKDGKLILS